MIIIRAASTVRKLVPGFSMLMSISRSQRLLAFYNDQCPVVNSTGVLWVQLTPGRVRNVLARSGHVADHRRPVRVCHGS